jgi:hypothetical protein
MSDIELFYSYSHKDEALKDQLLSHLSNLRRQGIIREWHDRKIGLGTEWAKEIDEHLNSADVILLLISSDFIASENRTHLRGWAQSVSFLHDLRADMRRFPYQPVELAALEEAIQRTRKCGYSMILRCDGVFSSRVIVVFKYADSSLLNN